LIKKQKEDRRLRHAAWISNVIPPTLFVDRPGQF